MHPLAGFAQKKRSLDALRKQLDEDDLDAQRAQPIRPMTQIVVVGVVHANDFRAAAMQKLAGGPTAAAQADH